MNWKIFDFRYGRANRRQFLFWHIIAGILISVYGSFALFISPIVSLVSLITGIYILAVIYARRMRDVGYSGKQAPLLFVPAVLVQISALPHLIATVMPEQFADYESIFLAGGYIVTATMIPFLFAYAATAVALILAPGSLGPNQYGYPPSSFSLKSMVSGSDDGVWKQVIEKVNLRISQKDQKEQARLEKIRAQEARRMQNHDIKG